MQKSRFLSSGARSLYSVLSAVLAVVFVLAGCGGGKEPAADGKVSVVTSFYPLYFLASEIGGEDARVVNLISSGVEPHDWSPKSKDLQRVTEADIFLYNGAGLEGWTDDFLSSLGGERPLKAEASRGVPLLDGAAEEEHGEEEQDHDHGSLKVDPHTWVSPKSMLIMAENVKNAYIQADSANKNAYESRYAELRSELEALDKEFSVALAPYQGRAIVVSHQAFAYLCRDYGLKMTSVMGLSPDAEPRAQDLMQIMKFIRENNIRAIFFEELSSNQLAGTIAKETGIETLVLNPLEGLTPEQEQAGETYISLMKRNLQNLLKALQ